MGRVFPMVIWSEFRSGWYRDDDHREDAPHFSCSKFLRKIKLVWLNFHTEKGQVFLKNSLKKHSNQPNSSLLWRHFDQIFRPISYRLYDMVHIIWSIWYWLWIYKIRGTHQWYFLKNRHFLDGQSRQFNQRRMSSDHSQTSSTFWIPLTLKP